MTETRQDVRSVGRGGSCETLSRFLIWGIIGAVGFWGSQCIVHLVAAAKSTAPQGVALIVVACVSTPAALYVTWAKAPKLRIHPGLIWLAMTVGIWASGPLAMGATDVLLGSPAFWSVPIAVALTPVFPVATFALAAYHGELGSVLVVPLVLLGAITPLMDRWTGQPAAGASQS